VTWFDRLDPDEIVDLKARFGSLREAGVRAYLKSGYTEEFEANGCSLQTDPDDIVYLVVPHRDREEPVGRLVVAAHRVGDEVDEATDGELARQTPGVKSRWRRADLETIFEKQPDTSARKLAESGDLVESIRHQRISELRARGDIGVDEKGRLKLPSGTTADGGWIILPKLG
jgi:hypothetical protein